MFIRSPYLHFYDVGQRSGQAASCELRRRRRLVQKAGQQQRQPPLRPAVQRQRRLARLRRFNSFNQMFQANLLRLFSILCCRPAMQRQRRLARLRRLKFFNRILHSSSSPAVSFFQHSLLPRPGMQRQRRHARLRRLKSFNHMFQATLLRCFSVLCCPASDAVTSPPRPPGPAGFMCITALACSGELMWLDNSCMYLRWCAVW